MKHLKILLSGLFVLALNACGSQEISTLPDMQQLPQQSVGIMSDKGLTEVNQFIGKTFFAKLDVNHDGAVTLEEYKRMQISDLEKRFKKVDKNKDNKITMDEMMMNRKNFLPEIFSKESLRQLAKLSFDTLNKNTDAALTFDEFVAMGTGKPAPAAPGEAPKPVTPSPEIVELYTTLFNLTDTNRDNSLSFEEYEDLIFVQMKGKVTLNNPLDQPQPVPPAETPAV